MREILEDFISNNLESVVLIYTVLGITLTVAYVYYMFFKLPYFLKNTGFPLLIEQIQKNPKDVIFCIQFIGALILFSIFADSIKYWL